MFAWKLGIQGIQPLGSGTGLTDPLKTVTAVSSTISAAAELGFSFNVSSDFAELVKLPLILREEGSATRRLLLDEVRSRNLRLHDTIEIESREAAREAAAQGVGLAIMSEGEVVPDRRLSTLRIADWTVEMEEWMVCLKSRAALHVIHSFFTLADEGVKVKA